MSELTSKYEPHQVEAAWSAIWAEKGFFKASSDGTKKPYCIVIPPPNVTGALHFGHALNNTLQDILIRFKRMQGCDALWIPGTDHAGIATQNVVERQLAKEHVTRQQLGREKFVERVWKWKEQYGGQILNQLRRLGASCDFSRERFTMDEGLSAAVAEVFVKLYEEGLIYRSEYIVNWCPRCGTALSDLEVEYQESQGELYHILYPFPGAKDKGIVVATTRPETMLGDTAVAVNPEDGRYQGVVGKTVILPLLNREIPLIADPYVDKTFGTGAVKITPSHDPNDFQIGKKHGLAFIKVIHTDGKMTKEAGPYAGLDRFSCRKKVLEDLGQQGWLVKTEPHLNAVGHCQRCKTVVEPMVSLQWFVKTKPLAEPAIKAVKEKQIHIVPETWSKTYFDWMENIRDWCISRQLWWGHRIPVWYCQDCGEINVAKLAPVKCKKCGKSNLKQDEDVLDTWFSSGLWPFSTLGWPNQTKDLQRFYPTDCLVTAFDIIFFWVARMIMMGIHFTGQVPFKDVYIHALVRDAEGKKMSKSRGNVVDPLEMIDKYGCDALRFTLAALAAQGRDVALDEDRINGYRNFCNKLWNANRFFFMNCGEIVPKGIEEINKAGLSLFDRWILSRLDQVATDVKEALDGYRFNDAALAIYDFTWHEYCDWYVELTKPSCANPGPDKDRVLAVHLFVLDTVLRLLHPFMPFITEEIWNNLPFASKPAQSLCVADWPELKNKYRDVPAGMDMDLIIQAVTAVRNLRSGYHVPPGLKLNISIKVKTLEEEALLEKYEQLLTGLFKAEKLVLGTKIEKPKLCAESFLGDIEVYVPLGSFLDIEQEKAKVLKEKEKMGQLIGQLEQRLADKHFLAKAPEHLIQQEKAKAQDWAAQRDKLDEYLRRLKGE